MIMESEISWSVIEEFVWLGIWPPRKYMKEMKTRKKSERTEITFVLNIDDAAWPKLLKKVVED